MREQAGRGSYNYDDDILFTEEELDVVETLASMPQLIKPSLQLYRPAGIPSTSKSWGARRRRSAVENPPPPAPERLKPRFYSKKSVEVEGPPSSIPCQGHKTKRTQKVLLHKTLQELQKEYADLTERMDTYRTAEKNVTSHHEKQIAFKEKLLALQKTKLSSREVAASQSNHIQRESKEDNPN